MKYKIKLHTCKAAALLEGHFPSLLFVPFSSSSFASEVIYKHIETTLKAISRNISISLLYKEETIRHCLYWQLEQ